MKKSLVRTYRIYGIAAVGVIAFLAVAGFIGHELSIPVLLAAICCVVFVIIGGIIHGGRAGKSKGELLERLMVVYMNAVHLALVALGGVLVVLYSVERGTMSNEYTMLYTVAVILFTALFFVLQAYFASAGDLVQSLVFIALSGAAGSAMLTFTRMFFCVKQLELASFVNYIELVCRFLTQSDLSFTDIFTIAPHGVDISVIEPFQYFVFAIIPAMIYMGAKFVESFRYDDLGSLFNIFKGPKTGPHPLSAEIERRIFYLAYYIPSSIEIPVDDLTEELRERVRRLWESHGMPIEDEDLTGWVVREVNSTEPVRSPITNRKLAPSWMICDDGSTVPYELCSRIVESRRMRYTRIVPYGPPGCGKTILTLVMFCHASLLTPVGCPEYRFHERIISLMQSSRELAAKTITTMTSAPPLIFAYNGVAVGMVDISGEFAEQAALGSRSSDVVLILLDLSTAQSRSESIQKANSVLQNIGRVVVRKIVVAITMADKYPSVIKAMQADTREKRDELFHQLLGMAVFGTAFTELENRIRERCRSYSIIGISAMGCDPERNDFDPYSWSPLFIGELLAELTCTQAPKTLRSPTPLLDSEQPDTADGDTEPEAPTQVISFTEGKTRVFREEDKYDYFPDDDELDDREDKKI